MEHQFGDELLGRIGCGSPKQKRTEEKNQDKRPAEVIDADDEFVTTFVVHIHMIFKIHGKDRAKILQGCLNDVTKWLHLRKKEEIVAYVAKKQ